MEPPLGDVDGEEDDELAELELGMEDAFVGADADEEEEVVDDSVEGRGEKDSDTLGLAALQNCWETFSAAARSPGHCELTQLVMSVTKRVALAVWEVSRPEHGEETWDGTHLPQKQSTSAMLLQPTCEMERSKQFDTAADASWPAHVQT